MAPFWAIEARGDATIDDEDDGGDDTTVLLVTIGFRAVDDIADGSSHGACGVAPRDADDFLACDVDVDVADDVLVIVTAVLGLLVVDKDACRTCAGRDDVSVAEVCDRLMGTVAVPVDIDADDGGMMDE